ncbi:MAG: PspC domain-containing protein [Prevotellaceae bacterium]|nr:PspC domain-containing protein [Prevotellaceae bacterium]
MDNKRLVRTSHDKWLGGICGGIAQYFGWDSAVVRLIYVFLSLFTAFCGVLAYIILWILMPEDNSY